jgi:hypothetical protein
MECIAIKNARYVRDYILYLEFNDGVSGEVDLKDIICRFEVAKPLRDRERFAEFYLDEWPTLAWPCGFDIAPETLHSMCVSNAVAESKVAESEAGYEV